MKPLTCREVAALLELHVAGECAATERDAVAEHLAQCPACARLERATEDLLGRLDLHFREKAGLDRLLTALAAEDRQRRTLRVLPLIRRFTSLAAMFLVAVGLASFFSLSGTQPSGEPRIGDMAMVQATPGTAYQPLSRSQVRLDRGELWLRPAADRGSNPSEFEVVTPAGVAKATSAEFFVEVRPLSGERPGSEVRVTVLEGSVLFANHQGSATAASRETVAAQTQQAPRKQVENLARRFAGYYQPVPWHARPRIQPYELPLDLKTVRNYEAIQRALHLSGDEPLLRSNGFVVLPGHGTDDLVAVYRDLRRRGVPTVVTSDAVLQLCHAQFEETLRDLEERVSAPDLRTLLEALFDQLRKTDPLESAAGREAQQQAASYLAVGLKLLEPEAHLAGLTDSPGADAVVRAITEHKSLVEVAFLHRVEDCEPYKPRGHYTRSPALARYFQAMTWFGRMALRIEGNGGVDRAELQRETLAATLLTRALQQARLSDGRPAQAVWEKLTLLNSFFVGLADDLGPEHYSYALARVCGPGLDPGVLEQPDKLEELRTELMRYGPAAIFSGDLRPRRGDQDRPERLRATLRATQGFRLFSQRYVPDAYMLGKLVWPHVGPATRADTFTRASSNAEGIRGVPRGLDVMAVLGSARARELLKELGDDAYRANRNASSYDTALTGLRQEFDRLSSTDWNHNLYWSWLDSLRPLLVFHGPGYPTYTTTAAYRGKALNTALASWSLQRHATVLEAKQGSTPLERFGDNFAPATIDERPQALDGYVEPMPELYASLLARTRMAGRGLSALGVLDRAGRERLERLEALLERLLRLACKELEDQELQPEDREFLADFVERFAATAVIADATRLRSLEQEREQARAMSQPERVKDLERQIRLEQGQAIGGAFVTDVHSDPNSGQVLEEATGPLGLGLFAYRRADGQIWLGAGPVLSYFEFKQPIKKRLTDEEWRIKLASKNSPAPPSWTADYTSRSTGYVLEPGKK